MKYDKEKLANLQMNVQTWMALMGCTIVDFAEITGLSTATISKLVNGRSTNMPQKRTLRMLSDAMGFDGEELYEDQVEVIRQQVSLFQKLAVMEDDPQRNPFTAQEGDFQDNKVVKDFLKGDVQNVHGDIQQLRLLVQNAHGRSINCKDFILQLNTHLQMMAGKYVEKVADLLGDQNERVVPILTSFMDVVSVSHDYFDKNENEIPVGAVELFLYQIEALFNVVIQTIVLGAEFAYLIDDTTAKQLVPFAFNENN